MAKQLSWLLDERTLRLSGLMLFTPQDLRHLLNASEVSIRFLLTHAHKRGDVAKLRPGLYSLDYQTPSELAIANALLRPSYVSLYYAMAYYNLIPEAPYEMTSATLRGLPVPERLQTGALNWKRVIELAGLYGREDLKAALQEYR